VPSYSIFHAGVSCPSCDREISRRGGETAFCWGSSKEHYWGEGSEIRWLRDRRGTPLPPFTWSGRRGPLRLGDPRFNFGDPAFVDLFAFDPEVSAEPPESRWCHACDEPYDHIAVVIRVGVIERVKVFTRGEVARTFGPSAPRADTVLIRDDGTPWPRPDWDDPTIS
jgi:hypothetical protein